MLDHVRYKARHLSTIENMNSDFKKIWIKMNSE